MQKGGVSSPGRGRQDVGRAVVMEPSLLGLKACLYSREGWGRRKEERKDGGLTLSHRFARPRGLLSLIACFLLSVAMESGLKRDSAQIYALCSLMPCPHTCCVSAY